MLTVLGTVDLATDASIIRSATRSGLRRADELSLSSIGFPALGTGVGGFAVEDAARLMVEEVVRHLQRGSTLRNIILVAFSADAESAFRQALERVIL